MTESSLERINRRKRATAVLKTLNEQRTLVFVVHYSCETFYPSNSDSGRSRRTTSIAVRNLSSGVTRSFSIHQYAEKLRINIENIEDRYDLIEHKMLTEFFEFARDHKDRYWLHWNMRDVNYGFQALEHRLEVLGGTPFAIEEGKRFDLARILVDLYGYGYMSHPRMENLMRFNRITELDFLTGEEESKAFENKEFVKLHQSTLRKVDVFCGIFDRAYDNTLKVKSSWFEIYGITIPAISQSVKNHPFVGLVIVIGAFAGAVKSIFEFWEWVKEVL